MYDKVVTRMAAARYLGKLDPFQSESETITACLEQEELFFQANEVTTEKKVAVFLSVIGGKTYTLLRNLTAPVKPSEKMLADLKSVLKKAFEPTTIVIAERHYFHQCT